MVMKWFRHKLGAAARFSTVGWNAGPHITRYRMYERLEEVGQSLDQPAVESALAISHSQHLFDQLGIEVERTTVGNYPDVNLLDLPYEDGSFDLVAADQVLEHVEGDPFRAVAESFRVLKAGGLLLHTTCFMYPRHGSPSDFWRFTPEALRMLAEPHGEVIVAEGWGNPLVWAVASLGLIDLPIPRNDLHPLNRLAVSNHPEWPVVTWFLARKGTPVLERTR